VQPLRRAARSRQGERDDGFRRATRWPPEQCCWACETPRIGSALRADVVDPLLPRGLAVNSQVLRERIMASGKTYSGDEGDCPEDRALAARRRNLSVEALQKYIVGARKFEMSSLINACWCMQDSVCCLLLVGECSCNSFLFAGIIAVNSL
jgi:hypothetical protein